MRISKPQMAGCTGSEKGTHQPVTFMMVIENRIRPRSGEKSGDAPSDSPPVKVTFKDAFKTAETL